MDKSKIETPAATIWSGQSIRDTLPIVEESHSGSAVFLTTAGHIAGFVTDGDIRRALIRGAELQDPISSCWTASPVVLPVTETIEQRYHLLKSRNLRHLVLLDRDGRFAALQTFQEIENLYEVNPRRCPVVLMAGGRGQRLMPLTRNTPKPMLEVGGAPLLQRTLGRLIEQGFEDFFLSVHYLKEQIIDFFGDGSSMGVRIRYLIEEAPMGTGGCLRLLPELQSRNLVLLNGDLMTDLDLRSLINFHDLNKFAATMVVSEIATQIDYGVVRVDGVRFVRLEEKPKHSYFINTGIYALGKNALVDLPASQAFDLPELFEKLASTGQPCGVYEHQGDWLDIGNVQQFEHAQKQFGLGR